MSAFINPFSNDFIQILNKTPIDEFLKFKNQCDSYFKNDKDINKANETLLIFYKNNKFKHLKIIKFVDWCICSFTDKDSCSHLYCTFDGFFQRTFRIYYDFTKYMNPYTRNEKKFLIFKTNILNVNLWNFKYKLEIVPFENIVLNLQNLNLGNFILMLIEFNNFCKINKRKSCLENMNSYFPNTDCSKIIENINSEGKIKKLTEIDSLKLTVYIMTEMFKIYLLKESNKRKRALSYFLSRTNFISFIFSKNINKTENLNFINFFKNKPLLECKKILYRITKDKTPYILFRLMNDRKYLFLYGLKYTNANTKFICTFEYKNYISQTLFLDLNENNGELDIRLCKINKISFETLEIPIYKIKSDKFILIEGYTVNSMMIYNVSIDKIVLFKKKIDFDYVKTFFLENFLEFKNILTDIKKQFLYFVILIIYFNCQNKKEIDFFNFVKDFKVPEICL